MTAPPSGGPPESERPGPAKNPATASAHTHGQDSADYIALVHRRRGASRRMVPLDCGCPIGPHADPVTCLCTFPPLTEHQLDGWRRAAEHVLADGNTPLVPIEVRRAWWRRGGTDRVLAERLHTACGEVVA